jgi:hypothetical protein
MALLLQCLGLPRSSLLAGLAAIGLAACAACCSRWACWRWPGRWAQLCGVPLSRPEWRVLWLALLLAWPCMRCPVLTIPAVAGQATPDSQVYRLFWSFDKGVAGWLLLLGLHDAPTVAGPGVAPWRRWACCCWYWCWRWHRKAA